MEETFVLQNKSLTLSYLVGKFKFAICLEHTHKRFFHQATGPPKFKIKIPESALKYSAEARKYWFFDIILLSRKKRKSDNLNETSNCQIGNMQDTKQSESDVCQYENIFCQISKIYTAMCKWMVIVHNLI